MKKVILLFAIMLTVSAACNAQESESKRKMPSPEQMAQRMTDRMASQYGLNDSQKTALLELNKKYGATMPRPHRGGPRGRGAGQTDGQTGASQQVARPSKEEMSKRREEMNKNMETYNSEIKKIFTDEQYKKYTSDQQNRRQKGQRGGSRKDRQTTE